VVDGHGVALPSVGRFLPSVGRFLLSVGRFLLFPLPIGRLGPEADEMTFPPNSSTHTGRMRGGNLVRIVLLALFWQGGAAWADAIVSGPDPAESLIEALANASNGTITFDPGVSTVSLEASATSTTTDDLTLTGRPNGLEAAIDALLGGYGIDVAHGTANFDGVQVDSAVLTAAIAGLPNPGVTLEHKSGGGGVAIDFWNSPVAEERSA
jgi:hypothetical protein